MRCMRVRRHAEGLILLLFGLPTAAIDWEVAATWHLPAWISLLAGLLFLGAMAAVLFLPRFRVLASPIAVAVLYGLPVIGGMIRWRLLPSPAALIGDGAYQMQLARDVLMRGVDPYGYNYAGSGMELAPWSQSFPNPALHHLDYWPGTVLMPLPLQALFKFVFGWWDERIWLLLAAVAVWILLDRLAPGGAGRMAGLAFFLIPGHSLLAVLGDNDLQMVALLLASMVAVRRQRWIVAGVLIGLAIATKQTALIAVPVVVAWSVREGTGRPQLTRAVAVGFGCVAILFAPFLMWNAHAFLTDTILFNFGGGNETYPIQGIGLSAWMLQTGLIHGARDSFPFLLIQLPLVFTAWLLAWRWFQRQASVGDAILWIGLAFFVFLFANRFSQQAYLLLGAELVLAGLIARLDNRRDVSLVALRPHRLSRRFRAGPWGLGGDGTEPAATEVG
jgi:hypothetical protein